MPHSLFQRKKGPYCIKKLSKIIAKPIAPFEFMNLHIQIGIFPVDSLVMAELSYLASMHILRYSLYLSLKNLSSHQQPLKKL